MQSFKRIQSPRSPPLRIKQSSDLSASKQFELSIKYVVITKYGGHKSLILTLCRKYAHHNHNIRYYRYYCISVGLKIIFRYTIIFFRVILWYSVILKKNQYLIEVSIRYQLFVCAILFFSLAFIFLMRRVIAFGKFVVDYTDLNVYYKFNYQ